MTLCNKGPDLIRYTTLIRGGNNSIHTEAFIQTQLNTNDAYLSDTINLTIVIGCFIIAVKVRAWLLTVVGKETSVKRSERHSMLEEWHQTLG